MLGELYLNAKYLSSSCLYMYIILGSLNNVETYMSLRQIKLCLVSEMDEITMQFKLTLFPNQLFARGPTTVWIKALGFFNHVSDNYGIHKDGLSSSKNYEF